MTVFYLNDRTQSHVVYFVNLHEDNVLVFRPQEGRYVNFPAPEGSVPWIKEWDGYTLISYSTPKEDDNDRTTTIPGTRY